MDRVWKRADFVFLYVLLGRAIIKTFRNCMLLRIYFIVHLIYRHSDNCG